MSENPWIEAPIPSSAAPTPSRPGTRGRAWAAGAEVTVGHELETREVADDGVWLMGAHGGAGTTSLARLTGLADAGTAWPVRAGGCVQVTVVARTSAYGIERARDVAIQWAGGGLPGVRLLGVVWVADAPGRLPRELRAPLALASGAFPVCVHVPFVRAWRLAPAWTMSTPPQMVRALTMVPGRKERRHD